jgi:hypothetical protein
MHRSLEKISGSRKAHCLCREQSSARKIPLGTAHFLKRSSNLSSVLFILQSCYCVSPNCFRFMKTKPDYAQLQPAKIIEEIHWKIQRKLRQLRLLLSFLVIASVHKRLSGYRCRFAIVISLVIHQQRFNNQ